MAVSVEEEEEEEKGAGLTYVTNQQISFAQKSFQIFPVKVNLYTNTLDLINNKKSDYILYAQCHTIDYFIPVNIEVF